EYDTEGPATETDSLQDDRDFDVSAQPMSNSRDVDDDYAPREAAIAPSVRQHLLAQVRFTRATPRDRVLVELLIEELDDNGYLTTPLEELAALLPAELGVETGDWSAALRLLQSFDPPGVGAATVSECLLLQLGRLESTISAEVIGCA